VSAFTLAYRKVPSDAETGAVAATVGACGGRIAWNCSEKYTRAYALVEEADERCATELRAQCGEAFVDRPIIALAVAPSAPEALRTIREALAGPGAPAGMRSCEQSGAALLLEWDFERTGVEVVLGLIDVELARFRASRVNALLTPLPLTWSARIAAVGLAAPEIAPDRVLEALIEGQHVAG
jgi:hypothetical protein